MAAPAGGLLTPASGAVPVDAGLLERFLEAERGIEWRAPPAPPRRSGTRAGRGPSAHRPENARLAYYHDETARIEQRQTGPQETLLVTSGPVGALVLLGECVRRGMPTGLDARAAGELPQFPEGAIEARWGGDPVGAQYSLPFADVVQLARYALA